MEPWVIILYVILLVAVAGVALWLIFVLGRAAIVGGVFFLAMASDQGFIGLAAYLAVWVFMFPVMLVICIIAGFGQRQEQKELEREDELRRLGHDDQQIFKLRQCRKSTPLAGVKMHHLV